MIALSLYLPELATDLVRNRGRLIPRIPIVLAHVEHQREIVSACCSLARRSGVATGMTVSEAKALLPMQTQHEQWDGLRLTRALRTLAHRALRFTPLVMHEHDGLRLDCTGCSHLFGGTRRMAALVAEYFARRGLMCRVGVAPVYGAAWAVARFGANPIVFVQRRRLEVALGPLPIDALRLNAAQTKTLRAVGVVTIAHLIKIPRNELAERCGVDALQRLDQAFGREPEHFEPVRPSAQLAVSQAFAGPTDRPETIALCVQQLLRALAQQLEEREAGCREVRLTLRRSDLPPVEIVARASAPSRDPKHWYTLLRASLERSHLGYGVEGVEIGARGVRVLVHRQATRWLDRPIDDGAERVAQLADTLKSRLGEHSVLRMCPRASHVPERAWTAEPFESFEQRPLRGTRTHKQPIADRPTLDRPALERPTRLMHHPVSVEVVHLVPDGPIGALRANGVQRRVLRSCGPERVCGEWWRRDADTRDYYQVQAEDGAWLWVYRSAATGRWFLHGEWA